MDSVYLIPGSSGNNWGEERICFDGNCMNCAYKYHKPISGMVQVTHLSSLYESKTALNLPVSNLLPIVESRWNNIPGYCWVTRLFMLSLFSLKWVSRQSCLSADSIRLKVLNPSWKILTAWTPSLWVCSFDLLSPFHRQSEKLSCAIRKKFYSNAHNHTFLTKRKLYVCLVNINIPL